MRAVAHFFVLGALFLLVKIAVARYAPSDRPIVEVEVVEGLPDSEVEARIDEAILVEEGLRFGWANTDPVIRRRLAMNMAFAARATPIGEEATEGDRVEEAIALGMHRTDPVVRGRLAFRVRQLLSAPSDEDLPDDEALESHLHRHSGRFEQPGRIRFVHVMLSREQRGTSIAGDAAALLARIEEESTTPDAAAALGDRSPLLPPRQRGSTSAIDRLFGRHFGREAARLPQGEWSGPIASAYGLHLVYLEGYEEEGLPPLEDVRERVLEDFLADRRPARIARRLSALRESYQVRLIPRDRSR